MEIAGASLKKLRLEKGISLEEAQKKTKIHIDILKSIENDSLVNLNPVYLKGFVKIYCGFLGVHPEDYLDGSKEQGAVILPNQQKNKEESISGCVEKSLFLKPRIIVIIVSAVILLFLFFRLFKFVLSKPDVSKKSGMQLVLPGSKPLKKVKGAKTSKLKVFLPERPAEKKAETVSLSGENSELGIRIGIYAIDNCWVQAKLDGKIIFQDVLKKGIAESWTAKDKAELSLGSAGSVRLEVNGKIIPSLGRKGQVLKNILITRDGLKVGK